MTCPTCHTQTRIVDSRCRAPGVTYRRHRCKNDHVFSTLETLEKYVDRRICEATGLRKFTVDWASRHIELAFKCDACSCWHLTPRNEPANTTETT